MIPPPPDVRVEPVAPGTAAFAEYVATFQDVFPQDAAAAWEFLTRYAGYANFRGMIARVRGECVGMAFGVDAFRGNWWVERVLAQVGEGHPAMRDAFCLVDLGVRELWRNLGIGQLLHDAVLAAQPRLRAVLSTQVANVGAQRFYLRYGWRIIHPGFQFSAGQEPYCVLAREVRSGVSHT